MTAPACPAKCHECAAPAEFTGSPEKAAEHLPGELLWRIDISHKAGYPYLHQCRAIPPGFALLRDLPEEFGPDEDWCDHCGPVLWWDLLPRDTTRLELRHDEEDQHAEKAATAAELVGAGR